VWKLTLVALVAALGCLHPDVVLCANGLACPTGDRCDEAHRGCVVAEQLTACTALSEGADCTAGPVSGGCFDGVCLARGCGNRVVETGEMCDDGNQISGDACSGDCRSNELCGNGVVDPVEECDDGNLVSRDGCDSRCRIETATWQEIAISPGSLDARETAYDAARGRLVFVAPDGRTWAWDGVRWTVVPTLGAWSIAQVALYYAPSRGQVEMIGISRTGAMQVYARSAGEWTLIDPGKGLVFDDDVGEVGSMSVAYDAAGDRVFATVLHAFSFPLTPVSQPVTTRVWSMDPAGGWTELPRIPAPLYEAVAAYDPVAMQLVVEDGDGNEWIYDGVEWTSAVSGFGARVSLTVDPERGHLVLVDGDSQMMYERVGAVWSVIPDSAVPCGTESAYRPFYYNAARASLELFSTDSSQICAWNASWTARVLALPFHPVGATYDPVTRSLVVLHDPNVSSDAARGVLLANDPAAGIEAWRLRDGGWERIVTAHAPSHRDAPQAIYSSGRAATILYGGMGADGKMVDTWTFDGLDWSQAAPPLADVAEFGTRLAVYDPTHGRVLLMIDEVWWSLGDDDSAWRAVEVPEMESPPSALVWDGRNATLVAAAQGGSGASPLLELGPTGWRGLPLVPGDINLFSQATLMSDPRSGGVFMFNLITGATWERLGTLWTSLPVAPVQDAYQAWSAYDPVDGSVLLVSNTFAGGVIAAVMTRTSATPLESCRPGDDLDGDGLAGCDDPECFWACARPPPFATRSTPAP
jgi:cysteine-rich repeat protein